MIRALIPTVWFNFRHLPFRQAVHLPVLLYKARVLSCAGKVTVNGSPRFGLVRLGVPNVSLYPDSGIVLEINGHVEFNGSCVIGNASAVSVGKSGHLVLGDGFVSTAAVKIACYDAVTFGNDVLVGWDCLFMDTDFHRLTCDDGRALRGYGKVTVGDRVWFGAECRVMKNTSVPDDTVVSAGTVLNGPVDVAEHSVIGNTRTVKVIREGCRRNPADDRIIYE